MSTPPSKPSAWHHLPTDEVLRQTASQATGLTSQQARQRQQHYGPNKLTPIQQQGALARLFSQFNNVLVYVLLIAALTTSSLGYWADTGVILAVVMLNAIIGFIQEGKAQKALAAIRNMLSHQAAVIRDSESRLIPAQELVPGDIVVLQSGDKVPADLRLIKTKQLRIDEAILTGESQPTDKQSTQVAEKALLSDRYCMAYSGTLVTYGQGHGVVIAIADQTEIGHISALLSQVQTLTTPLLKQINKFGQGLTIGILAIAAATFTFGLAVHHYSTTDMFLAAVGLFVAAIPEGLPAIMTVTLAIGVQSMAKRNAIIRRLPAVETLGAVTVICSDKTGTLTRNEMTATTLITAEKLINITGIGYNPHGEFQHNTKSLNIDKNTDIKECCLAATLCNDARVHQNEREQWQLVGDPTEGALITLGLKAGLDIDLQQEEWPRTDVIPFDASHKFMATLHHDHAGHEFIYIKGAPEKILEMCSHQRSLGDDQPLQLNHWHQQINTLAQQGQRLLAIAFKVASPGQRELKFSDVDAGLTLLGVIGLMDPPRAEAQHAIGQCKQAGIVIKMITGDHAATAASIAQQLGITANRQTLTGQEIDQLNDAGLQQQINHTHIFARTTPEHKLRIVEALQAQNHVVAMTGDGVNDAPALKRADVGIAMGQKGTEVSKEAAEMVLADDNFASIYNAVEEGRTVYDNIKKAILFILPTNGGEALTLIAAVLFGLAMPITPAQILWVNMITAVTLALALAFEPAETNVMQRPPRAPNSPILSKHTLWRIAFVSLILVAGTFGLFLWNIEQGNSLEYARTVAVNTLVMFEIFYLFNTRYTLAPVLNNKGLFGNRYALIAIAVLLLFQLLFTYLPFMQAIFNTQPLTIDSWISIILISASVLFLVEFEKMLLRRSPKKAR